MKRFKVLLDCDGVIADLAAACFKLVKEHTGDDHTHDELTKWDIFDSIGKGHVKFLLDQAIKDVGWCRSIPVISGAKEFVASLEGECEVVYVTSPMLSPNWYHERTMWLFEEFGATKDKVILTSGKHHVDGDVFIDDTYDNCVRWHEHHPDALTILWAAPHNFGLLNNNNDNFVRIASYVDALEAIMERKSG